MSSFTKRIDNLLDRVGHNDALLRSYKFILEDGTERIPDNPIEFALFSAVGQFPRIVQYEYVGGGEPFSLIEAIIDGGYDVWDEEVYDG